MRLGIGADSRIGYHFIYPGCGYGGSCFPKDMRALIHTAEQAHCSSDLLQAVEAINGRQKHKLFERINAFYQGDLRGKTFALWGLAFKPNTDDMRDAPSRTLLESLWAAGASVRAFDPEAMQQTQLLYPDEPRLMLMGTPESVLPGADALVICTEWQPFKAPDFDLIQQRLKAPVIFLTVVTCSIRSAWPTRVSPISRWVAGSRATCLSPSKRGSQLREARELWRYLKN
nr:hypothetical protein GCM10020185_75300 [Pseudomonas brassicacearum subsp. brassicacearum]